MPPLSGFPAMEVKLTPTFKVTHTHSAHTHSAHTHCFSFAAPLHSSIHSSHTAAPLLCFAAPLLHFSRTLCSAPTLDRTIAPLRSPFDRPIARCSSHTAPTLLTHSKSVFGPKPYVYIVCSAPCCCCPRCCPRRCCPRCPPLLAYRTQRMSALSSPALAPSATRSPLSRAKSTALGVQPLEHHLLLGGLKAERLACGKWGREVG